MKKFCRSCALGVRKGISSRPQWENLAPPEVDDSGYEFKALLPEHYTPAVRLILDEFFRDEKTCKLLGMPPYPNHERELEKYLYHLAEGNRSFVAVAKKSREVVGVLMNEEVYKDSFELSVGSTTHGAGEDSVFAKVKEALRQNKFVIPNIFKHFDVNKYFYFAFLSVKRGCWNKGIATNLLKRSELLAKDLGFKLLLADATADQTKHILVNLMGYKVVGEMKYRDFIWKGKKVLKDVDENETMQLVVKTCSGLVWKSEM